MGLIIYSLLKLALSFFGSKDLLTIKLGRSVIIIILFTSAVLLHSKFKYATDVISALGLITLGFLNTWALSKNGPNVTISGEASELIGSEHTTICFILLVFVGGNAKFNMGILLPIYVLVSIAMLIKVYDENDQENKIKTRIMNVTQRVFLIAFSINFAHYLVVLQEAELFLEKNVIKVQQK